jgi:hypothetical protein
MSEDSQSEISNAGLAQDFNSKVRPALFVLAALSALGGVLRGTGCTSMDWQTMLFFFAAGIILLLPWATKIKLSKEGVEMEMPSSVRELGVGGKTDLKASPPAAGKPDAPISLTKRIAAAAPNLGIKHPDDPQKDMWGGLEVNHERRLSASVKPLPGPSGWCVVKLVVSSTNLQKPLAGEATFHLHPTFKKDTATVPVKEGRAQLELVAWGAFTVGAECDGGQTKLELDLATLPEAPEMFRSR